MADFGTELRALMAKHIPEVGLPAAIAAVADEVEAATAGQRSPDGGAYMPRPPWAALGVVTSVTQAHEGDQDLVALEFRGEPQAASRVYEFLETLVDVVKARRAVSGD